VVIIFPGPEFGPGVWAKARGGGRATAVATVALRKPRRVCVAKF
jgi:hypothetical protein